MTKEELTQLQFLYREIDFDKARLREVQKRSFSNISGMPFLKCFQSDGYDNSAQISFLQDLLNEKIRCCMEERNRLESYILTIEDSLIRQIFVLRYANGYSWNKIAFSLGETDESYVRKKHNRYIKEHRL